MATSSEIDVSATENENPRREDIQPAYLQLADGGESIGNLQQEPSNEAEQEVKTEGEERSREISVEEIQPSSLQSMDGQDSVEKRKREDIDEESGEARGALRPLWKTSLCSYFRRQSGSCSHGEDCRYAHGEAELRPRPDKSWDPTSERAKKLMKSEDGERVETLDARQDVFMTDSLVDSSDPTLDKCLVHLPQSWTSEKLRSFLDEQGVLYKMAKKRKGMTVGFVSFETADQLKNAFEGLDGKSIGNKRIKVADVIPRSFEKKTKFTISLTQSTKQPAEGVLASEDPNVSLFLNGSENGDTVENDFTVDNSISRARSVRDAVTPLAHMPYNDQLDHKKKSLEQTLKRLTRNTRKACPDNVTLPEWILKSRDIGGLPCKLEGILESPVVNGYRNKCEFSVGYSVQGKPTVGFMLGNFREGVLAVEEPKDCPNVSRIACKFASIFQEFLQHSGLPIWNRLNNTGFWRQLTVREGRNPGQAIEMENLEANISEVMLMVQVCSVALDDEIIKNELQRMTQAFAEGATASTPPLPLTSLVIQDHKGISNAAPADAPLHPLSIKKAESAGQDDVNNALEARIHDYISDLRFCISPTAFFQVNTLAAEKLYALAGEWAGLGPDTLLFDICCGTGTIGLTLAHRVGMVVGIEMNASAVSDAHRNAEINGIKNCRFVCAKAEDIMGSLLKEYLNVSQKQEEMPHVPVHGQDQENGVSNDRLDLNGSSCESGDFTSAPGCPQNSGEESKDPKFQSSTSEDKIGKSDTPGLLFKNVVAIVDPPRVGLHPIVIKVLRTHPSLRRLVYISCNPESLVANAIELCTPSTDKTESGNSKNRRWRSMSAAGLARQRAKSMPNSEPFQPVRVMGVDLFPHTPHCEVVMLLER